MAMDLAHSRPQMNSGVYRQSTVSTNPNAGKRIYKVWKGSNRFFCGGRLVFGPDVRSLLLTLTLIICPVVIFCVFVGKHLMVEFPHRSGIAIVAAVVTHAFFVLVFLFLTSARDPGIVPRNAHPPEPDEEVTSSSDWSGSQTPPKNRLPRTKDITVNGVVVKVKYCDTCMLYRPPRCSHCSICNNCVERFDHHCPWVGQCIGQRNYPFFFMFVLSATLLCFLVFAMSALRIKLLVDGIPHHSIVKALQRSPASVFLMIYTFLASWFVGGLTVFHLYLIGTNQTTYENFRYRYDNRINPYDRGLLHNFKNVLCSGIPASKVRFRAKVPHEIPSVGNYTPKQRESMDILSPKFGNPHSKIEMGSKSSWTATAVGQNLHAAMPNSAGMPKDNKRMVPYDPTRSPAGNYQRDSNWARQSSNWGYSSESLGLSPAFGPPGGAAGINSTLPPYITHSNNPSGFGSHTNNPVFVSRGNNPVYVSHSNNHRVAGSQVGHSNQRPSYQYQYPGTGK